MKSKWMRFVVLMILVMIGCLTVRSLDEASQSELVVVEEQGKNCGFERLGRPNYVPEWIGWNEQIGMWRRKGRPYRNPLRRHRMAKKARIELRGCIARLHELEEALANVGGQERGELSLAIAQVSDGRAASGRWG